jgi:hypothetical protein
MSYVLVGYGLTAAFWLGYIGWLRHATRAARGAERG